MEPEKDIFEQWQEERESQSWIVKQWNRLTSWWEFDGRFKSKHDEPAVDRSLIMSPFNDFFTWQTTDITEIVEQREDYIKFKTQNSDYELWKLNAND